MRWRVVGAVVFVLACSYAMLWAFDHARARVGEAVEGIAAEIELSGQPRFKVRRGVVTLPAGEEKRLRIENLAGRVEVVPGGPETVAEYVIYARGEDEADARDRAREVEVRSERIPGSQDAIRVAPKQGGPWPSRVSVDLVVRTPPERTLSVETTSADVSVTGVRGGVEAKATSGDVRVTRSGGPVVASSTSGDLRVEEVDGSVEARATSGDITVAGIQGESVSATSISGDIGLSEVDAAWTNAGSTSGDIAVKLVRAGRVEAHSISGDIAIEVSRAFSGDLESRSVSGDIGLSLSGSSGCTVHARTVSGSFSGRPWSEIGLRQASASLGSGAGSVSLSTTSGDIRLEAAD